ncbi:MAG: DUF4276 family protein [Oscillatoria sp. SIO1A7]|nr:DUF4276 family protein [Oscillatoria sp. SIO1A7]
MNELNYTLLSDGSSDKAFEFVLTWLLRNCGVECAINFEWVDLRQLPQPPKKLPDKIKTSLDLYPCDLLFIHRDAEKEPRQKRITEIKEAIEEARKLVEVPPAVCVVPVRMQEAWLLFDESAIRKAAGKPRGKQPLQLPAMDRLEQKPDPKQLLHELLRQASERKGRALKKLRVDPLVYQVASFIGDFSPLRALSAFSALEEDIQRVVREEGWGVE